MIREGEGGVELDTRLFLCIAWHGVMIWFNMELEYYYTVVIIICVFETVEHTIPPHQLSSSKQSTPSSANSLTKTTYRPTKPPPPHHLHNLQRLIPFNRNKIKHSLLTQYILPISTHCSTSNIPPLTHPVHAT